MAINDLLEPELLYTSELKQKHNDNVVSYFDNLVKISGVNPEENKKTCKAYYDACTDLEKLNKKSRNLNLLKVLFIILCFIIVGIFLLIFVYKPKRKALDEKIKEQQNLVNSLLAKANQEMAPLNALFESSIPSKIMETTTPLIDMDRIFDVKKYEVLRDKYGMWDNSDEDSSTLDLQSGNILGNPFVVFKELNKKMMMERYEGTLSISYYVGSGQNRRLMVETLHAFVEKPKPVYSTNTYLLYGNDAAPNLTFSRNPSEINKLDEKGIEKYVRHHEKDLEKMAEKATKKGGNYTPLGNSEFELFFGGLDRNNEIEYRLLFTPLAQKSMLQILKSKVGFGDDFRFVKDKGLNLITSTHSQGDVLFVNASDFKGFDFEKVKEFFITFNNNYFKALFFDFAPLFAIPLYQQHKSQEYIYKNNVGSNFNCFEHEVVANRFDISRFKPKNAGTNVILKTSVVSKEKESDIVNVSAHAFEKFSRTDYVPKLGGDGKMHSVPVHWVEYVPVSRDEQIRISDLGLDDEVKFNKYGQRDVIYAKGLVSIEKDINVDIEKIKSFMKKD